MITLHLVVSQVCSADASHPDVNEVLYEALRRVFLCLDALTDLLLTPGGTGEDDPQWRLLQQEVTDHNTTNITAHFSASVLCRTGAGRLTVKDSSTFSVFAVAFEISV